MLDNNNNNNSYTFENLPSEMIQYIFDKMTYTEISRVKRVSHFFKAQAEDLLQRKENNISQACKILRSDPIFHTNILQEEKNNILIQEDMSLFFLVNVKPNPDNLQNCSKKIIYKIKLTNEKIQVYSSDDRRGRPQLSNLFKFLSPTTVEGLKLLYSKQFAVPADNNMANIPRA